MINWWIASSLIIYLMLIWGLAITDANIDAFHFCQQSEDFADMVSYGISFMRSRNKSLNGSCRSIWMYFNIQSYNCINIVIIPFRIALTYSFCGITSLIVSYNTILTKIDTVTNSKQEKSLCLTMCWIQ